MTNEKHFQDHTLSLASCCDLLQIIGCFARLVHNSGGLQNFFCRQPKTDPSNPCKINAGGSIKHAIWTVADLPSNSCNINLGGSIKQNVAKATFWLKSPPVRESFQRPQFSLDHSIRRALINPTLRNFPPWGISKIERPKTK